MTLAFARKVDQQCLNIAQTLKVIDESSGVRHVSLLQAGYLQLELALRWYLLELTAEQGADDKVVEFVSIPAVVELNALAPCGELNEILDLLKRPESWLAGFLRQLQAMRSGEPVAKLKGSIFQVEEHQDGAVDQIALKDVSNAPEPANAADLKHAADDFSRLVERQRAVRAEF